MLVLCKLDPRFEFLGQFWIPQSVSQSTFPMKKLLFYLSSISNQKWNFPCFCSKLALIATYIMSYDFKMNFNCMIEGPQTSELHIRPKSDPHFTTPFLAFKTLLPPGCRYKPTVHRPFPRQRTNCFANEGRMVNTRYDATL